MSKPTSSNDPDFYLEELDIQKHILDYHTLWSDAQTLTFSSQKPKRSLSATRAWMYNATKLRSPRVHNYGVMLPASSPLNPTNPASRFWPPPDIKSYPEEEEEDRHATGDTTASPPPTGGAAGPAPVPRDTTSPPRSYLIGLVGVHNPAPLADDPQPVGPGRHNRGAEIGYMIHASHWGCGLGSRAVGEFVGMWWGRLNVATDEELREQERDRVAMDTLEAHIDPENTMSEKIASRVGFERSERLSGSYVYGQSGKEATGRVWRMWRPGMEEGLRVD